MAKKQKLTLTVDSEVIERAKGMKINISEITEDILRGFSFTPSDIENKALLDKYCELFDTMKPRLKKYNTRVKVGEIPQWDDDQFVKNSDLFYLPDDSFLVPDYRSPVLHIEEIDVNYFINPLTILKNFIDSLATSTEKRKQQLTDLEMVKRIINAIDNTSSRTPQNATFPKSSKQKSRKKSRRSLSQ